MGWDIAPAFALCIAWGIVWARIRLKRASIGPLPADRPEPAKPPLVSVIVAAKEEQEHIQETIRHIMRQTYARMEIIAVNDRSNDATGAKLEALKAWSADRPGDGPPLKVIHVTSLPEGWLGKNHALYQGYLQAKGTYLLFTDADVRFEPNTVRDTVSFALEERADHVTLLPKLIAGRFWLRAFVHYFLFSLCLFLPPWLGNDDRQRKRGIGVGAFNFIRRDAYEAIGTHRAFRMRPDDDLRLGMLVKQSGGRQRVAGGADRIAVEWYPTLTAAAVGLEKNLYAGFAYRLPAALAAAAAQLLCFVLPLTAPIWSRGPALGLWLMADVFLVLSYLSLVRAFNGERGTEALALPVSALMLVTILLRSVFLAHRNKGVYWRGTFYSLDELKRRFS